MSSIIYDQHNSAEDVHCDEESCQFHCKQETSVPCMNIFDILAAALAGIGTGLVGWVYTFPYFMYRMVVATVTSLIAARFANRVQSRIAGHVTGVILTVTGVTLLLLHYWYRKQ